MFLTVPVSTMPSASTWSVCFFFSSRSSSRTERRESTTLPRRRVGLLALGGTRWPPNQGGVFPRRGATPEPGGKAFPPPSTARPPLTAPPHPPPPRRGVLY